ncbi:hypothetical protein C1X94_30805, partial [Pseudomonas sp. FW306-02-H05-AB]
ALATLCAAFCIYSNPRSGIALAIVGIGACLAIGTGERDESGLVRRTLGRLAIVGGAVALIAAPQIVTLLRFEDLYYFVQYERYA